MGECEAVVICLVREVDFSSTTKGVQVMQVVSGLVLGSEVGE